jgi:hypothetical protein
MLYHHQSSLANQQIELLAKQLSTVLFLPKNSASAAAVRIKYKNSLFPSHHLVLATGSP